MCWGKVCKSAQSYLTYWTKKNTTVSALPVTSGNKERRPFYVSNWRAALSNHLGEMLWGALQLLPAKNKKKDKRKEIKWTDFQCGGRRQRKHSLHGQGPDINGEMVIRSGQRWCTVWMMQGYTCLSYKRKMQVYDIHYAFKIELQAETWFAFHFSRILFHNSTSA